MKHREVQIIAEAYLWNGKHKLPGQLTLTNTHLEFVLRDFTQSHLKWRMELDEIESAKDFLVFNLARQGLRIMGKEGKSDLFVLENVEDLGLLLKAMKKIKSLASI